MNANPMIAHLEAIEAKLDRIERRQQVVENLVDEMTPVVREALKTTGEQLSELEARGYFAFGRDMMELVDRMVSNDAVEPVNVWGAMRATRDADVQHGLGIAIEILRHLGRSHDLRNPSAPQPLAPSTRKSYFTPAPAPAPTPVQPAETVEWNGHTFTGEGFLVDASAWDESLASAMAEGMGVALTDDHWTVVRWARDEYLSSGASPNVRRVASGSGLGTRRIYELFPKSPGKTTAMLAGIPKPVGCI